MLADYEKSISGLGFRRVLHIPFRSEWGSDENLIIYFRDNGGVLLPFDTFNGGVNRAAIFYNWKPNIVLRKGKRCLEHIGTGSGHYYCKFPAELEKPASEEIDRKADEYFVENAVWVGDEDFSDSIHHKISMLERYGTLLSPWVKRGFLWLIHYGDHVLPDGNYRVHSDPYYKKVEEERLGMLPEDVRRVVGV